MIREQRKPLTQEQLLLIRIEDILSSERKELQAMIKDEIDSPYVMGRLQELEFIERKLRGQE